MDDLLLHDVRRYARLHVQRRRWRRVLTFLAAVVVFCTTYALILPAITMTAAHTHDESCYTQLTAVTKEQLACPAAASGMAAVHQHDARCYDENGELLCPLPELAAHTHTDSCYAWSEVPTCTRSTQPDESAEPVLICGMAELIPHRHSAECFDADGTLLCPLPEVDVHQHTDACFVSVDVPADPSALTCTDTDPAHVHGPLCYGTWKLTCDQGAESGGADDEDVSDPSGDDDRLLPDEDDRAVSQITMKYYVFLDGEQRLLSSDITYLPMENGRHYITADALEAIYGSFGFAADTFGGERFFPHTDQHDPSLIWADAAPYQAVSEDGSPEWRIPLSSRNSSYLYYLPRNSAGHDSCFTVKADISDDALRRDNMFYTVNVSAPADYASEGGIFYVSGGDPFQIGLTPSSGFTWTFTDSASGVAITPDSAEPLENGKTLYTFHSVSSPIKISAITHAGSTGVCTVRYRANTLAEHLQRLSGEVSATAQYVITDGTVGGMAALSEQLDLSSGGVFLLRSPDSSTLLAGTELNKQGKRFFYTFRGWRVKATGDILDPSQPLTAAQLSAYENGGVIDLEAAWSALDERGKITSVNFYINLFCEIRDDHSNGFSDYEMSDYTRSLHTSNLLGTEQLTDLNGQYLLVAPASAAATAYEPDSIMRSMTAAPYKGVTLTDLPSDEDIFAAIKLAGYTIRIGGVSISPQHLTSDHFQIRWSSLKYQPSDGWHADGVLVVREAKLRVTKTFLGSESAIAQVKAQSGDQEYGILVEDSRENGAGSILTLFPAAEETRAGRIGYTSYDASANTYTWIVGGRVDSTYLLSEQNYLLPNTPTSAFCRIYDTVNSSDWENYDTGSTVSTQMISYAADVPPGRYRTAAFRNTYVDSGTLTLRKIDSFTFDGLADVAFSIVPDANRSDFQLYRKPGASMYTNMSVADYTEKAGTQIVTDRNGDIFLLLSPGSYTLTESIPSGYSGASQIHFTVDDTGRLTALTYEGELTDPPSTRAVTGVGTALLTVENRSHLLTSVTARKDWGGTPEDRQEPVTVRLLCGGLPLGEADSLYTQTLNAENNWTFVWEDLPLFVNGKIAEYSLKETMIGDTPYHSSLPDGYSSYAVTFDEAKYREGSAGDYDDPATWVDAGGTRHYANYVLLTVRNRLDGDCAEIAVTKAFQNLNGAPLAKIDGAYYFGVYSTPEATGAPLQTASLVYGSGAVTPEDGLARFTGLTIGKTYYVFELDDSGAPIRDGSSAIVSGTPFTVFGGGAEVTLSPDSPVGEVTITNRAGYAELPETGGIGSGILCAAGGLQAVGAALLLVRKKRPRR